MKDIIFLLGLILCCLFAGAQKNIPEKLHRLKPNRQLTNFLQLDPTEQSKPNENYQLILSHSKWYAVGNGDGQVFTSENGEWKRIDSTRLEGYHYGAFLFDCNGTLTKYGGYGFWRNHGMFVSFHEHLGDWQIQPCDREIPFSGNLAYFNRTENNLYTFGNYIYNQANSEDKTYLDSLYRIDMLKMKWENLGKLNSLVIDKFHLHYRINTLPGENGVFILPISTDSTALYFNFETLKYHIYNSKNNIRLFRFFKELPTNLQVFSDSYGLKILDMSTLSIVDSLTWGIALNQPIESSDLLERTTSTVDLQFPLILAAIGLLFGAFLVFTLVKRKTHVLKNTDITTSNRYSNILDLSISNTLVFKGAMYPIDYADYLVIQKFIQQDATTIELNDWLGLENKQPENQKKQRAEWIKRMNAFFKQIGFNEEAFYRERQETDKRMFVYKMNSELKEYRV